MEIPLLYIINCNNNGRKERMENRMKTLNLNFEIVKGIEKDDLFLPQKVSTLPTAIMLSHLKAIRKFVQSGEEIGIIGEDDIHLKKTFPDDILAVTEKFKKMQLDVLLLGYLINFDIRPYYNFQLIEKMDPYSYHEYPDDLWGAQLYMISRKYGQYLLDKYNLEYLLSNTDKNFSSDWIITKDGKRAAIYPMLAIEEGNTASDIPMYMDYHSSCRNFNLTPDFL